MEENEGRGCEERKRGRRRGRMCMLMMGEIIREWDCYLIIDLRCWVLCGDGYMSVEDEMENSFAVPSES